MFKIFEEYIQIYTSHSAVMKIFDMPQPIHSTYYSCPRSAREPHLARLKLDRIHMFYPCPRRRATLNPFAFNLAPIASWVISRPASMSSTPFCTSARYHASRSRYWATASVIIQARGLSICSAILSSCALVSGSNRTVAADCITPPCVSTCILVYAERIYSLFINGKQAYCFICKEK